MLDIDLATIVFEIFNFLLLSVLLYRFLLRPVLRQVQERAAEKERLMQEIAQEREAAAALKTDRETQLSQVQTEAAKIINQAEKTARQQSAALRQEAYDEAERVLVQAQLEMAHWRERAVAEFHDDLLNTILTVSAKLMAQAAPSALHDTLVQQLSDRIWQMGREEMERVETIRRSLRDREPTVYVTTARPLTTTQQGQLVRTFTALVDQNVSLELKIDADLAAGLHIRLGDLVVENSITGQLADLRQQTAEMLSQFSSAQEAATGGRDNMMEGNGRG